MDEFFEWLITTKNWRHLSIEDAKNIWEFQPDDVKERIANIYQRQRFAPQQQAEWYLKAFGTDWEGAYEDLLKAGILDPTKYAYTDTGLVRAEYDPETGQLFPTGEQVGIEDLSPIQLQKAHEFLKGLWVREKQEPAQRRFAEQLGQPQWSYTSEGERVPWSPTDEYEGIMQGIKARQTQQEARKKHKEWEELSRKAGYRREKMGQL